MKKGTKESVELYDRWLVMEQPASLIDELNDFARGMKKNRFHKRDNEINLHKKVRKSQSVKHPGPKK